MELLVLALINLLLAFYGGGAVVTALRLYRESGAGGAAAHFPREYSTACGALGGCGLVLLLLAALALWGILDSSLRRRRIILVVYGGAMVALCVAEVALGAWLVWRAQRAQRVQAAPPAPPASPAPRPLAPDLQRLVEMVSLSEPVDGVSAAWVTVLALLQAGAVAAAAVDASRADKELRLRRRFSHILNPERTSL